MFPQLGSNFEFFKFIAQKGLASEGCFKKKLCQGSDFNYDSV